MLRPRDEATGDERARTRPRGQDLVAAAGGGLCLTAATPPMGFWPLAIVGVAVLAHLTGTAASPRRRFARAWVVWFALFLPTLWWMREMTAPGYLIASIAYAALVGAGTTSAGAGATRFLTIPAGIAAAEWIRWRWPFGGVPLSNLAIGQVAGPLAPLLRVGGALLVVIATAALGCAAAAVVAGYRRIAGGLVGLVVVLWAVASLAPSGSGTDEFLDVALVQGGGPQGTRAVDTEPGIVTERHLAASAQIDPDRSLDLLLWPEDVVDVSTLTGSPEDDALRRLARDVGATFLAGVVEDDGPDTFRNWAVVYDEDGEEVDRYEKVERVPFGEWVPFRGLLEQVAGDALPARDAGIGTEPAVVDTPVGRLGVSISWEIFFGERARDAIGNGGAILVNPTNGASFSGTQVQSQQVASSRMRAIETGRWVTQIAPTGFTAVIDPGGHVRQRTAVSERAVLYDRVELRTGQTLYVRYGDLAAILVAAALTIVGLGLRRRSVTPPT